MVAYGVFTLLYSNTELTVKKILIYFCYYQFFTYPYSWFLKKQKEGAAIVWAFWVKRTPKDLKIVCVKFIGKIGRTLVADLAYVIVHDLKSVCRTL